MKKLYDLFLQYPAISTDTRTIIPGSVFVCLKGDNFDGNRFALAALEKGAKYVITEDKELQENEHCIVVDDCLETLQQLSLYHRNKLSVPVIGITGTNGKTTTKELLAAVLSEKYRVAYTKGNLNNHIGVPLTLLSIKPDDEIAIIEMGANHPGEIADLCKLAKPDYGIITNIGKAHIEGFKSVDNIIAAKRALYDAVIANAGTLFINADDALLVSLTDYEKVVFYGKKSENGVKGDVLAMDPFLSVSLFGREVTTHLTGYYNMDNILCAASVGEHFAVSHSDILKAIAGYTPHNNRSQIIRQNSNTIIADFYNANPSSMEVAITNFDAIKHDRKLAILGDMLELGEESAGDHKRIIALCEALKIKALFVGKEFYDNSMTKQHCFVDVDGLNDYLSGHKFKDALILIKGSRGIHLENCISKL